MIERTSVTESNRPPGILEHLSEAMSLVLEFPRLMLIPLLLDLYLLLGGRISSESLTSRLGQWLTGRGGSAAVDAGQWVRDLGAWDATRLLALLMPSVMDGLPESALYRPFDRLTWHPASAAVVAAAVLMALIGSGIFITYLVILASHARMIRTRAASFPSLILDRWLKLLGFAGIMVVAVGLVSGALILPGALLASGGMSAESIVGLLSVAGLALLVVTMFVPEAIVLDGAGPIAAIRSSATVVFRFFWQSVAFFAVSLMISPGLLSIWEHIAGDPVGLGIALVLNALMVTSLALASLAFYRARFDGAASLQHSI